MAFKSIIGAACTCLTVVTFNAVAAPIEADWLTSGDGLVTYDSNTGLEWLDLTVTANRTYNDISSLFDVGEEFEGWRYATSTELITLWNSFGGNDNFYSGYSVENKGLFSVIAPLMGDLRCNTGSCTIGTGRTMWTTQDAFVSQMYGGNISQEYIQINQGNWGVDYINSEFGSALVRVSSVPIPAAFWLFGSGLIGLIGIARRKKS